MEEGKMFFDFDGKREDSKLRRKIVNETLKMLLG
jgi:hypothetical protein